MTTPVNFLLVHGACHGAWCWNAVAPLLRAQGCRVLAIDLPGRGDGRRPGWGPTLADYARSVADAAAGIEGPVVAVGHSMGGQMISAAAELASERFARLIYLSAFLPIDGDSIATMSRHNEGTMLPSATRVSLLTGRFRILPAGAPPVFYGDCPPTQIDEALSRLVPESVRPSMGKLRLSPDRFGRVPRAYIRLTEDRAITPTFQDWMLARQPCQRVASLAASHSPFLSMPAVLARTLIEIGRED